MSGTAETVTTTLAETTFADGTQASGSWEISYDANGAPTLVNFAVTVTAYYPQYNDPTHYTASYDNAALTQTSPGVYALTFGQTDGPYMPGGSNPFAFGTNVLSFSGETPAQLNTGSSAAGGSYVSTGTDRNSEQDVASGGGLADAPCFTAGTRILTPSGEVRVEDLKAGDLVTLADGRSAPIRWIGNRAYNGRFIKGNVDILPVTFVENSLGHGVPHSDLTVSPKHAMFIDGLLIPAMALVNGTSIVQAQAVESVEYFHVELDAHEILMAQGAPTESFVDDNSRDMFNNAATFHALYPNDVAKDAKYCAPRVDDGFALAAIRTRLARRVQTSDVQAQPGVLRGFVEAVSLGEIQGWAQDGLNPEHPVELQILDNGAVIGRTVTDRYDARLQAAGLGSGKHGFTFVFDGGLDPAAPHDLQVRRVTDGALLQFHVVEALQAA